MEKKKQKSRISLRNLLRNKKTAMIAVICCVVAAGAYIGLWCPRAEAANNAPIRGIVNNLSEIEGRKTGERDMIGSPQNPFVILEIVPYQHYASMPYMVEGCFPYDVLNIFTGTSSKGLDNMKVGNVLTECALEEEHPDSWTLQHSDAGKDLNGYYEKITSSNAVAKYKPDFQVSGFEDGKPQFEYVGEGEGDYIWVTLQCSQSVFDTHASRENAVWNSVDSVEKAQSIEEGDRYYTIRKVNDYYWMGDSEEAAFMFRHYNDLMRHSLRSMVHSKSNMDNFSIVVKPIEPQELNENPKWIDYADLIYIHSTNEMEYSSSIRKQIIEKEGLGSASAEEKEKAIQMYSNITVKSSTFSGYSDDYDLKENPGFGYFGTGEWSAKQNDISWGVAQKLFLKANALERYDGSQIDNETGMELTYAPVIIAADVFQSSLNGYDSTNSAGTKNLDYATMQTVLTGSTYDQGYNNNFYKFALMSSLMDQDVFHDFFFSNVAETGKPVIQTSENGEGICVSQSGLAQTYWNPYTFLPYVGGITEPNTWTTDAEKEVLKKYRIHSYLGGFMSFPANEALLGYTYICNSNGNVLGIDHRFAADETFASGIYSWFESTGGERTSVSAMDVIYFLLNYRKVKQPAVSKPSPTPSATQQPSVVQQPSATKQPSVSQQESPKKPAKVAGVSIKRKKKTVTISWKRKVGVDGYQLQYALNKKFTKKKKTKNVRSATSTIRGLKKGKTYYIRIRAYKKASGKKNYGKWSKVKKVKMK